VKLDIILTFLGLGQKHGNETEVNKRWQHDLNTKAASLPTWHAGKPSTEVIIRDIALCTSFSAISK